MARIYFDPADTFAINNSNVSVYGSSGSEMVTIANGVTGVTLDQNVEQLSLSGLRSAYTYQQSGNQLLVYSGTALVCRVSVQDDSNGTQLAFSDGTVDAKVSAAGMTLGGNPLGATTPITPTPTTNLHASVTGVDTASLLTTQSSIVMALNGNDAWTSTALTYSFDSTRPADYTGVQASSTVGGNLTTGWQKLSASLGVLSSDIIASIDKLLPLSFSQTSANGDIRFSQVPTSGGVAAFAYFPGTTPSYSGDVFIDTAIDSTTLGAGGYGQHTIVHELGHALGLKHSFSGGVTLPTADDHRGNTVMSYTAYQNTVLLFTANAQGISYHDSGIFPDRFMVYDIAALQAIYGTDTTTATGSNTYQYGTNPFYATIWDAGGSDALDLSATTASNTVDLVPGHYSSINTRSVATQAQAQKQALASQGFSGYDSFVDSAYAASAKDIYTGTNNLGIAYGTVIENLIGGSAADTVHDNKVDNNIKTGAGDDLIYLGAGGYDTVDGGTGIDTVFVPLTKGQVTYASGSNGLISLVGIAFAADLYGVEKLAFSDQTITV